MFAVYLALAVAVPGPAATPTLSPKLLLGAIRAKFRSHRPPPPYVVYTIDRKQLTDQGFPDYADSYKEKVWCRSLDRAALSRRIYRSINRGELIFERPAFNEDRDPGPPTADVFEPAPLKSHPISFVPTPEPAESALPTIGSVSAIGEFDYNVDSVVTEGDQLHLKVLPSRDPDRNRLRELWVDKQTLELEKVVATDKLFILGTKDVYGVTFTVTLAMLDGRPVVTDIHGVVGDGYTGDGSTIDYKFRDITFPSTLPAWYFDERTYKSHDSDAPM
ncbi:MAG: hypothetical protein IAI50_00885 [Candidatus Eremiobacteraeota bacterium]|nr:hypothetical protein [Candidatus Eremiobacteraeota bacterium]